jgi:hypothetical protein
MKLNVSRPALVITGLWNPAIFQPPWLAATIFKVPSGEPINFFEVVEPGKVTHYFGELGISVPPARLELSVNTRSEAKWAELEDLALKLLETLPHTPIQGLGINFRFEDTQPDPAVIDKLWTGEGLETQFEVASTIIRSVLKFDDCDLNLAREIVDGNFNVDFNFHHSEMTVEKAKKVLPGSLVKGFNSSKDLLAQVYETEVEDAIIAHTFPAVGA